MEAHSEAFSGGAYSRWACWTQSRSRPVMCWKRYCEYSTQVRNGTCCRKAIRTTKLCIDAFKLGAGNEILRLVLTDVANELRENGALDEEECFIDATFVMAKGGGRKLEPTKRGKGMKIMAIVDRHGLPLSVSTHAANHHEVRLVQLCFDFYMIEAKPENLIGDRAYDSDPLDEELRNDGIEHDRAASFQSQQAAHTRSATAKPLHAALARRALLRLDTMATSHPRPLGSISAQNFLGFVQRACLVVLFRRF